MSDKLKDSIETCKELQNHVRGGYAVALTHVLDHLEAVNEMLAASGRIDVDVGDNDFIIGRDWDRDSGFWIEQDSHGNRTGGTVFTTAVEAFRSLKENQ